MMAKMRTHKKAILQHHSNRYTLTIPPFFVKKVLGAEKGSTIKIDFQGNKVILEKQDGK